MRVQDIFIAAALGLSAHSTPVEAASLRATAALREESAAEGMAAVREARMFLDFLSTAQMVATPEEQHAAAALVAVSKTHPQNFSPDLNAVGQAGRLDQMPAIPAEGHIPTSHNFDLVSVSDVVNRQAWDGPRQDAFVGFLAREGVPVYFLLEDGDTLFHPALVRAAKPDLKGPNAKQRGCFNALWGKKKKDQVVPPAGGALTEEWAAYWEPKSKWSLEKKKLYLAGNSTCGRVFVHKMALRAFERFRDQRALLHAFWKQRRTDGRANWLGELGEITSDEETDEASKQASEESVGEKADASNISPSRKRKAERISPTVTQLRGTDPSRRVLDEMNKPQQAEPVRQGTRLIKKRQILTASVGGQFDDVPDPSDERRRLHDMQGFPKTFRVK